MHVLKIPGIHRCSLTQHDPEDYSGENGCSRAQSKENVEHDKLQSCAEPESIELESDDHLADFLIKLRARGIPMNVCMDMVKEMKFFGKKVAEECVAKLSNGQCTGENAKNPDKLADDLSSLQMLR